MEAMLAGQLDAAGEAQLACVGFFMHWLVWGAGLLRKRGEGGSSLTMEATLAGQLDAAGEAQLASLARAASVAWWCAARFMARLLGVHLSPS